VAERTVFTGSGEGGARRHAADSRRLLELAVRFHRANSSGVSSFRVADDGRIPVVPIRATRPRVNAGFRRAELSGAERGAHLAGRACARSNPWPSWLSRSTGRRTRRVTLDHSDELATRLARRGRVADSVSRKRTRVCVMGICIRGGGGGEGRGGFKGARSSEILRLEGRAGNPTAAAIFERPNLVAAGKVGACQGRRKIRLHRPHDAFEGLPRRCNRSRHCRGGGVSRRADVGGLPTCTSLHSPGRAWRASEQYAPGRKRVGRVREAVRFRGVHPPTASGMNGVELQSGDISIPGSRSARPPGSRRKFSWAFQSL